MPSRRKATTTAAAVLLDKLRDLPPERLAEVEDFVDFLAHKVEEDELRKAAMKMSGPSFKAIWDNELDAAYDKL